MSVLRTKLDVILVLDQDGQAVQVEFYTTLKDQLELTKRFPKVGDDPGTAPIKLVYVTALRTGAIPAATTFEQFQDLALDLQIEEPLPLVRGGASQDK